MKHLQLSKGPVHILFLKQFLGTVYYLKLLLKIMFEVHITELPVQMKEVIEILYVVVIGIPDIIVFISWNRPGSSPLLLNFLEVVICGVNIFFYVYKTF